MKNTMSYILALFIGLFVGWLAQQFWFIYHESEAALPSERNLARFQSRLESLKLNSTEPMLVVAGVAQALPKAISEIDRMLLEKDFEGSVAWYYQTSNVDLARALEIAQLGFSLGMYEPVYMFLYEHRPQLDLQDEEKLLETIYQWVARMDKILAESQQTSRLADIYRLLVSLEAENTDYYLRLSYWLIHEDDLQQARQALVGAMNDITLVEDVRQLELFIEQKEQGMFEMVVPLTQSGEHFLVDVSLDDSITGQFMIDTGASKTVIKSSLWPAFSSNVMTAGTPVTLNTANGKTTGLIHNVEHFRFGSMEIEGIEVVAMDLPDFQHDGLLGMNVLNRFEFAIDQTNLQLKLFPKVKATLSVP